MIELSGTLFKGRRSQNDVVRQLFLSTIFVEFKRIDKHRLPVYRLFLSIQEAF